MSSGFYRAFEDLHRGSRELIQSRQEVYLPFVAPVCARHPGAPVTDLGCGRGEWLALLRQRGLPAQGVDRDEGMLAACREAGLDARHGDALGFLRSLPEASQAAVTAFHVAEHLPFDELESVIAQALRVLRPGGLLVLETPNPENLVVGTSGFYMDPTHVRPLPFALLEFMTRHLGFGRTKVLRLNAGRSPDSEAPVALIDVLAGVSPDYAVVAQKPGALVPGEDEALDTAFARDHGVGLSELALRRDREQAVRLDEVRELALAAQARAFDARAFERQVLGYVAAIHQDQAALRAQVLSELHAYHAETQAFQAQLLAMHQSTSWRVTAPLRWVSSQWIELRRQGLGGRLRSLLRQPAAPQPAPAVTEAHDEPPSAPPPLPELGPEADRIHAAIARTMRKD